MLGLAPLESVIHELTAECGTGAGRSVSAETVFAIRIEQFSGLFCCIRIDHAAVMEKVRKPEAVFAVAKPARREHAGHFVRHGMLQKIRDKIRIGNRSPERINIAQAHGKLSASRIGIGVSEYGDSV